MRPPLLRALSVASTPDGGCRLGVRRRHLALGVASLICPCARWLVEINASESRAGFAGNDDDDVLGRCSPPWRRHHGVSQRPEPSTVPADGGSCQLQRQLRAVGLAQRCVGSVDCAANGGQFGCVSTVPWWHGW